MAIWTEQDHGHWSMLDKFYTQIWSLVELEILSLHSAVTPTILGADGVSTEVSFRLTSLLGLLALEDAASGQIGFLSRWSKLNKLQELRRLFSVNTKETKARMGEREIDWFVTHLPALKLVEFMSVSLGKTQCFTSTMMSDLRTKRP